MNGTVSIQKIYEQYHEEIQFLRIYIREAHPIDGWWMGRPLTKKVVSALVPKVSMAHYDPPSIEERRAVAGECESALQYGVRTYVDEMDDYVNNTYAAWPTRLYLIGLDGKVVYPGGIGPWGMKPKELKVAIANYLEEI